MNVPATQKWAYKILRMNQVIEITGLGRSTIYNLMDSKSKYYDPNFPKAIKLTDSATGWLESEINRWIELKIASR